VSALSMTLVAGLLALSAPRAESQASPPMDLQALIDATQTGGTLVVPAGHYPGHARVSHSMTLRGEGRVVLDAGGDGDVLTIAAPDVTIEGLVFRGTGTSLDRENCGLVAVDAQRIVVRGCKFEDVLFGIHLKNSPDALIAGNTIASKPLEMPRRGDAIRLWMSSRTVIEDNVATGSRDIIVWYSDDVVLRRNRVSLGRYGMHFMYASRNVLEDNVLVDNSVGAFLMYSKDLTMRRNVLARNDGPSGFGIGLKDMDGLLVEDNLIVDNRVGLHLDNSPMVVGIEHRIQRNVFAYNDIGIAFMPNVKGNQFTENSFLENVEQVAILGAGVLKGNEFAVDGRGNFWSDYRGFDLDDDGVGDIEYRADALFENLVDRDPRMRLFMFSPAQHAIGMAARAFPVVAPRPKVVDPHPLTSATAARITVTADAPVKSGPLAGLTLIALALLAVLPAWLGHRQLQRASFTLLQAPQGVQQP
jgi:nitrous oxidase accessory protein